MSQYTVALVDDHQLFLDGMRAVLASHPDLKIVACTSISRGAASAVQESHPDVVVLDWVMPGVSGLSVMRDMIRDNPQRHVLALSMNADQRSVTEALRAGVRGYACKSQPASEVVDAIRAVASGNSYFSPQVANAGITVPGEERPSGPLDKLTAREREVFDLTIAGQSTRAVARQLSLSPRTVETHRSRILRKFGVHSALDLLRMAANWGMLPGTYPLP
jgi:DNA-binding NarL/FixJ family response regulator